MSYMNFADFTNMGGFGSGYGNYTNNNNSSGTDFTQYALLFDKMDGTIDGKYNDKDLTSLSFFANYDYTQYTGSGSGTDTNTDTNTNTNTANTAAEQKLQSFINANVYLALEGNQIKFDDTQTVSNVQATLAALDEEIKATGGNMLQIGDSTFYGLIKDASVYLEEGEEIKEPVDAEEAKETAEEEAAKLKEEEEQAALEAEALEDLTAYINAVDDYTISGTKITFADGMTKSDAIADLATLNSEIKVQGELLKIGKTLYSLSRAEWKASNGVKMDAGKAAEVLLKHFGAMDKVYVKNWIGTSVDKDGKVSRTKMMDTGSKTDDPELKAAIEWFTAHGEAFNHMEGSNAGGSTDGNYTKADLQKFLSEVKSGQVDY